MKDADGNLIMVHTDGNSGPYILVPKARVTEVKQALIKADTHFHSVIKGITIVNHPDTEEKIINLGNDADVKAAQSVLDALK
jgi:hypothetical protein